MEKWRRRIRSGIIRSSRVRLLRTAYRKACQLATWEVGRRLANLPGVEAVYTRHSHPRSTTFAPGQSDLDLTIVLNDSAAQDAALVRRCTERLDELGRIICFVWPQDVRLVSARELKQIESAPGTAEILSAPSGWIRIGGREVRCADQLPVIERSGILLHPEFNSWWRNVLQSDVMAPQTNLAPENMRLCFRVAMKSELHLQAGRGRLTIAAQTYLPDSDAESLFADDAEMTKLLAGLQRNDFFAADAEARKARILQRSMARAGEFYRDLPIPADATWVVPPPCRSAWLPEAHRAGLRARLESAQALCAIAETIIIYPTPHWGPHGYQIDLLLHDDVPAAVFDDAVQAIKRTLGGRTFGIQGTHAQLTMIPHRAFEHPYYLLGTPFPFLHEHLATFAETLFGPPPRIAAPPSRAERLGWCARYFLFHRFTLHYRPGYVSKDCNFCQLAAMRLFLDKNVVATDAEQVRSAYLDAFVKQREESHVLDFLLRGQQSSPDEVPFAAVLELQSREYDAVEASLRREGALA